MRTTRVIPAAAIGAAVILLAGCSTATPQEQAVAEYKRLVEASANGDTPNYCEGREGDKLTPAELPEGADIEVEDSSDGIDTWGKFQPDFEGRFNITSDITMLGSGGVNRVTVWVKMLEGEDPCVHTVSGWR